jgi:acetyltransferase-like isoleucine patch superfamily enzyme
MYQKNKNNLKIKKLINGNSNRISNLGILKNVIFDISGNNNSISIGKNSSINNTLFYIRGDNHLIDIGENCYYGQGELWIEDNDCSLIIHSQTTVERAHLAVTESFSRLEIHKDCMISNFVEIRTGDSHSIIDLNTNKRINKAENVTIEEHVWIGAHAKILKGVTIKKNSIIGIASIVTNNIPENSIASGVPARVIRTDVTWDRSRLCN